MLSSGMYVWDTNELFIPSNESINEDGDDEEVVEFGETVIPPCSLQPRTTDRWLWDDHHPGSHSLLVRPQLLQEERGGGGLWPVEIGRTNPSWYRRWWCWKADAALGKPCIWILPYKKRSESIVCFRGAFQTWWQRGLQKWSGARLKLKLIDGRHRWADILRMREVFAEVHGLHGWVNRRILI